MHGKYKRNILENTNMLKKGQEYAIQTWEQPDGILHG